MTSSPMMPFLSLLETVGEAALSSFWAPLAVWTVVAAGVEVGFRRWGGQAPVAAYRLAQAVLAALPAGLAAALLVDPAWLPAEEVVVLLPAASLPTPASPPLPAAPAPPAVSVAVLVGVATLAAGLAAAVALVRLGLHARTLGHLRSALPSAEVEGIDADVAAAAERARLRRAPDVLVTSADVVPLTLGVRRPLVVLPAGLGPADRRLALAHEFHHVRRADPLAHWAEAVTAAVFVFHPLVSRLARRCDLYREMACDAALLADTSVSRRAYAALISAFALQTHPRLSPTAVGMADSAPHVHQRLLAMTTPPRRRPTPRAWALATVALAVAGVAMTAGRALAEPAPVRVVEVASPLPAAAESLAEDTDAPATALADTAPEEEPAAQQRPPVGPDTTDVSDTFRSLAQDLQAAAAELNGSRLREAEAGEVQNRRGRVTVFRVRRDTVDQPMRVRLRAVPGDELERHLQAPAYFLDGARIDQGALDTVAPGDIVSVEVLKGEAAEARGIASEAGAIFIATRAGAERAESARQRAAADAPAPDGEALVLHGARPNPSADVVAVSLTLAEAAAVRVEVFDLTGRRVATSRARLAAGAGAVPVDVSGLAAGAYVYRVHAPTSAGVRTASGTLTVAR